jgi:hypothetical protein
MIARIVVRAVVVEVVIRVLRAFHLTGVAQVSAAPGETG